MKKWLIVIGTALLFLAGGGGFWLFSSLPKANAVYQVKGVQASVRIIRDSRGVPHISAQSELDAYFALGFAHAEDRLWQMEMIRRHGAGRLSEVLGASSLFSDRYMRMLGIGRLADLQYERLDEPTRSALKSYAAGVNAWLDGHSGALPIEFIIMDLKPEPWRPADSLLWSKAMAMKLSGNLESEMLRARLAKQLDQERINELWPGYPADGPVMWPNASNDERAALYDGLALDRLTAAWPEPMGLPAGASNGWVVAGQLTKSGKPLLANDPHLNFYAPIVWYLASIEVLGRRKIGATVPGVPFTILGRNDHIAWGMTSTQSDLADLFVERLDANDQNRYLTPDGALPFTTRQEIINVKNAAAETLMVRETRRGPVVSDILMKDDESLEGDKILALSATYLREDDLTPQALYHLNQAQGWSDFTNALKQFHSPQMNLFYADKAGNIGFVSPGLVPIRRGGNGLFPSKGWTGDGDWTGFVPFDELPASFNPPQNRIVNANNKVTSGEYPYLISNSWDEPYRAKRIIQLLDGRLGFSPADMEAIQLDSASLMAKELLGPMTNFKPTLSKSIKAIEMLSEWDGKMSMDAASPAIFMAWLRELNRAVYEDELNDLFKSYWTLRPRFILSVLGEKQRWCDNIKTSKEVEDCQMMLDLSLERALEYLSERLGDDMARWRWGDIHQARFNHPLFKNLPVIGHLINLAIKTSGGEYTVNRGSIFVASDKDPFAHIHGAGYRAVYDLSDLDNSRFMIATGQSGNPLSRHYGDMLDDWRDGRYFSLADVGPNPEGVVRLEPR